MIKILKDRKGEYKARGLMNESGELIRMIERILIMIKRENNWRSGDLWIRGINWNTVTPRLITWGQKIVVWSNFMLELGIKNFNEKS